jgi:AFG3 family protein
VSVPSSTAIDFSQAVPLMVPPQVASILRQLPAEQALAGARLYHSWSAVLRSSIPDSFGGPSSGSSAGSKAKTTGGGGRKQRAPQDSSKSKGKGKSKGSGSAGSKGKPSPEGEGGDSPGLPTWIMAGLAGVFLLLNMMQDSRGGGSSGGGGGGGDPGPWGKREWTWQEVRTEFLSKGLVESFEVHNKESVRVALRQAPDQWFVDRAARSAEAAMGGLDHHQSRGRFSRHSPDDARRSRDQDHDHEDHSSRGDGRRNESRSSDASDARLAAQDASDTDPYSSAHDPADPVGGSGVPRMAGGKTPQIWFRIGSVESFERQLEDAQMDLGLPSEKLVPVKHVEKSDVGSTISTILTFLVFGGIAFAVLRGLGGAAGGSGGGLGGGGGPGGIGRMFQIGKANITEFGGADKTGVTFKDVAGCDEAKREVMEFVQFLRDPDRFTRLGAKIPKGAILQGPPGTGKTLLAKAVAGEADVPFLSMSGSDFIEMFVGVGPSRVRDLFKQAREKAPCIVFIDEIDAVARARSRGGMNSNDERENTLNQMLVEMDGFSTTDGVVVLAGTNRVDILDPAILRPGRFDRQITVDKPDIHGRKQIFEVYLKKIVVDGDIEEYARRLATLTPGFAGAEIANICNEAAIFAARRGKDAVDIRDFESATDRVIGGLEKGTNIMSPEERRTVAYHEAGHAVAGWFLEHADPLLKVTIVPRSSGALGFAQYLPREVALYSKEALVDRMCMALGGRASEELNFGRITTGASDDLDKVTQMAYAMTTIYGMNSKIGQLSFPPKQEQQFSKPYSDKTAALIDEEARDLVERAYARTKELLDAHKDKLAALAERLLERETVNQDDIVDVLGERPFVAEGSYKDYLQQRIVDKTAAGAKAAKAESSQGGDDDAGKTSTGDEDGDDADEEVELEPIPGLQYGTDAEMAAWNDPHGRV